jgi:hypothetical protein
MNNKLGWRGYWHEFDYGFRWDDFEDEIQYVVFCGYPWRWFKNCMLYGQLMFFTDRLISKWWK